MGNNFRFPASGAYRWLDCLASVREEARAWKAGERGKASAASVRGDACHKMSEVTLKAHLELGVPANVLDFYECGETLLINGESHEVTLDDLGDVQEFVDYVLAVASRYRDAEILIEVEVDLSKWTREGQTSRVDIAVISRKEKALHVIDGKFGKGTEEEAVNNPQLMLYARALLDQYLNTVRIKDLVLHIAQPPRDNFDSWEIEPFQLIKWADITVTNTVQRIETSEVLPYAPTAKNCRYCLASPCRAAADVALSNITETYDNLIEPLGYEAIDWPNVNVLEVRDLDPVEIFRVLRNVDLINVVCKAIQARAQMLLEKGQAPKGHGYKLVESRTNRTWEDKKKADKALAKALKEKKINPEERFEERKLRSPTQMENLLGKKHSLLDGDESLVYKPPGGVTLAPETDKRPAITDEAAEGFDKIDNDDFDCFYKT